MKYIESLLIILSFAVALEAWNLKISNSNQANIEGEIVDKIATNINRNCLQDKVYTACQHRDKRSPVETSARFGGQNSFNFSSLEVRSRF